MRAEGPRRVAIALVLACVGGVSGQHVVIRSTPGSASSLVVPDGAVDAARGELGPGARVSESEHFVIVSDADVGWTSDQVDLLERAHDEYMRFLRRMGIEGEPLEEKLLCVMIEDHERFKAYARAQDGVMAGWVAGYYASASNRVVFSDDRGGAHRAEVDAALAGLDAQAREIADAAEDARRKRDKARASALSEHAQSLAKHATSERARVESERANIATAKAVHEAVHLLAFNTGLQSRARTYPFWLTEGLAASFETGDVSRSFGPQRAVPEREAEFEEAREAGALVPLGAFVSMDRPSDAEAAEVMYAQAYALFTWLYRHEREALAQYFRDVLAEPAGVISPARHAVMFERRFGDVDALERRWLGEGEALVRG